MFNHSCCCDPGNPAICDPFEDDCPSTVFFGANTKCQATVDFEIRCPRWCDGGGDIGPINLYLRRSAEIEFDSCVLTRVEQGNLRFYRGQGKATVKLEESGQIAREQFEDCYGGNTILNCPPYQASYTHEVDMKVLLSCAEEFGTLAQFAANPCTEQPQQDDIGYLILYASSCYKGDANSRFYREVPQLVGNGVYACESEDAYLDAPRSGWAWYAYYKAQDCIVRQPLPLVWKRLYGGFANWGAIPFSNPNPCVVNEGTVFSSTDSNFAVRINPACDFDWNKNESWSAVYPNSCTPLPGATFGEVATCAQVLSGSCQQTSVQMDIPTIT
jgi:hypothetical protein